jgi:DNA invertase Pin-like site-specific DNA recombinase
MRNKRVALYLRVSTMPRKNGNRNGSSNGNGKREQTTENQRLQLYKFAEAMDWDIVAEFKDYESGAKDKKGRPQFRAMFEAASRREFDIVLVWSLDRFSRQGIALAHTY